MCVWNQSQLDKGHKAGWSSEENRSCRADVLSGQIMYTDCYYADPNHDSLPEKFWYSPTFFKKQDYLKDQKFWTVP